MNQEKKADFSGTSGADSRAVRDTTVDNQPARVVATTRAFATDIKELWDAVTNPQRVSHWFLPVSGDFQVGGRYDLEGNASGTITRCDSPNALELTWEFGGNVSWVILRLDARDNVTLLTLEHVMTKEPEAETHWKQYGPGATGVGWDLSVVGLAQYVDDDSGAIDKDAIDQWIASDSGEAFMRQSAYAWGVAHIENGEDESIAKAMAEETYAAYSGG